MFILRSCIFDKILLIEQSGPIKSIAELTLQLLTVEHIPDLVRHLPVRLVDILPLGEWEGAWLDILHLEALDVLYEFKLIRW